MAIATAHAWYSPEVTIWRTHPKVQEAYRELVALGIATHIVREVRAKLPGVGYPLSTEDPTRYDSDTLWELARRADEEFSILRTCGIGVPDVEWHVPIHEGIPRLVARVGIVRGYDLYEEGHGSPVHAAFERDRDRYYASVEPGARLNEVNARQCIAADRAYMVDVEPIF